MAKKGGNPQNLKPIETLSSEEAKKRGSAGGKKSVQARREKKLMSQIYGEILAKKHKFDNKETEGEIILEKVVVDVLARRDSASVAMIKEIREATEGAKLNIDTTINQDDENVKKLLEKHGIKTAKD